MQDWEVIDEKYACLSFGEHLSADVMNSMLIAIIFVIDICNYTGYSMLP